MNRLKFLLILIAANLAVNSGFAQVGINTTTPLSTLDINGNLTIKEIGIVNANVLGSASFNGGASGSAKPIDDGVYISLTPTFGNVEFILPNAVNVPGRIYVLRNISTTDNAILYSFGGKFFAKDSSNATCPLCPGTTTSFLTLPYNGLLKTLIVISDGLNWTYFF
ncbi:hypothetical protein [Flavobacterium sp.]|uniref:hypothetical protein n=1 Tax=Flavobacterium sp. TaxID=239 RepID=UPI00248885B1|nr:hypothetical protein [Flavobacterium sp.]MDI1317685.1 hypothetical protein [Flavobacterium sp.]